MYLDPASSSLPLVGGTDIAGVEDQVEQRLWRQVRSAYPGLPGSAFRLEQGGGDHLLLIVNEKRAFRFPRPGKHGLDLERAVLRLLGQRTRIAIPDYDIVDPNGCFASYLLVPGVSLTPVRFSALPANQAYGLIRDAVRLLTTLHGIASHEVQPLEAWPRMWSVGQFADRLQQHRLPVLADRVPTLAAPIERFLERYRAGRAFREVVLHGDLVGDHLLVDEHDGRLTGVIDFSDVALGDPAHDLLGFWAYGASAAAYAVTAYDEVAADRTLFARSRDHFIRYRIDRLFEMIVDDAGADAIQTHSTALAALLADLGNGYAAQRPSCRHRGKMNE